jgi:hypothetical protein
MSAVPGRPGRGARTGPTSAIPGMTRWRLCGRSGRDRAIAELWKAVDKGTLRSMAIGGRPRRVVRLNAKFTRSVPALRSPRDRGFTFLRQSNPAYHELANWFGPSLYTATVAFQLTEVQKLARRLMRALRTMTLGFMQAGDTPRAVAELIITTAHPLPARSAPRLRDRHSRACSPGSRSATFALGRPGTGAAGWPSQRAKSPGARMTGMRSWMSATSSLASVVIMANVRSHSPESRLLPVLPNAGETERGCVFHGDGIGLLRPTPLDGLSFEDGTTEAVRCSG